MLWLLFLPFTIIFSLLLGLVALPLALVAVPIVLAVWLPLAILKFVFRLVLLPVVLLIAAAGVLVGAVAIVGVLVVPLIPLGFLALCGWLLWRLTTRPARTTSF